MKFIAAYLLAHLGASAAEVAPPSKDDVRRILESIGAAVEEDRRLDLLFAELEGKDVAELIAAGRERLAYTPCASGAGAAGVGSAAAAGAVGAEAKEEEKKKEEEKVEEEDDEGMGLSLFDD